MQTPSLSGARRSASASASRAAELARIARMTVLERMELALSLGRRRRQLQERRAEGEQRRG
jgi:hypothetical protein